MSNKILKDALHFSVDIGTSTTKALILKRSPEDDWDVLGFGLHASEGIKKSSIVDLNKVIQSVRYAVDEAELMAGYCVDNVSCSLSTQHLQVINSHGIVPIAHRYVTREDMDKVIEAAQAVVMNPDHQILHGIAKEFTIDNQSGICEPLNMAGVRLEVALHLVTASSNSMGNLLKVMQDASLNVKRVAQDVMASAYGVLCDDEMDLGCVLVDIGAGTTKVTVFQKKAPIFSTSFPMAGDQITSDIALALHTPKQSAETIKLRHGTCSLTHFNENNVIQIPMIGEKTSQQTTYSQLHSVITPRVEEIFQLVLDKIIEHDLLDKIPTGLIITGGSARLDNIVKSAQRVFNTPVRVGFPKLHQQVNEVLDSPACACVFGLSEWSYQQQKHLETMERQSQTHWWGAFKKWIVN